MREEENYVQRSYKSDSDRRQKDWRRQPDFNPVHDKYKTEDVEQTVAQILALEQAGCDIIRCAVPTMEAAKALKEIKNRFIYHLWQISILIIVLLLQPWKTVQIRSGSIPEISAVQSESKQWLMWQRSEEYPFVLV